MARREAAAHAVPLPFQEVTDEALDLEVTWSGTLLSIYRRDSLTRTEYLQLSDIFSQYFLQFRTVVKFSNSAQGRQDDSLKRSELHSDVMQLFDSLECLITMNALGSSEYSRILPVVKDVCLYYNINNGENIADVETVRTGIRELDSRLAEIDRYASDHPGRPVSGVLLNLFPGIRSGYAAPAEDLPKAAPAAWASDKLPGDTPPDFIKRHYEPWLGKGLTRPDIKRLDAQLYGALNNWLRHNEMPADFDLPTLKEKNDRWVERVQSEGWSTVGDMTVREAARLNQAVARRRGSSRET